MLETVIWGHHDNRGAQGWAQRNGSTWTAEWSAYWDTLERGGPVKHIGNNVWVDEKGTSIGYGHAVVDDFGFLAPVDSLLNAFSLLDKCLPNE